MARKWTSLAQPFYILKLYSPRSKFLRACRRWKCSSPWPASTDGRRSQKTFTLPWRNLSGACGTWTPRNGRILRTSLPLWRPSQNQPEKRRICVTLPRPGHFSLKVPPGTNPTWTANPFLAQPEFFQPSVQSCVQPTCRRCCGWPFYGVGFIQQHINAGCI